MNISEGLFAFLLFLAIIPAYVFAVYGLYISRMTSIMISKLLEHDMNNTMGSMGGPGGAPVHSTTLSIQDFAKLINNSKAKTGGEEGDSPRPVGGHYL